MLHIKPRQLQFMLLLLLVQAMACVSRHVEVRNEALVVDKRQIAEFTKGDVRYEVYQIQKEAPTKSKSKILNLSIRLINVGANVSPLRAISKDLEQYSANYEYFLNHAQQDVFLRIKNEPVFPKYYFFENNYNAFPFDVINVGFAIGAQQIKKGVQLVFVDKLLTRDSIFFNINIK